MLLLICVTKHEVNKICRMKKKQKNETNGINGEDESEAWYEVV